MTIEYILITINNTNHKLLQYDQSNIEYIKKCHQIFYHSYHVKFECFSINNLLDGLKNINNYNFINISHGDEYNFIKSCISYSNIRTTLFGCDEISCILFNTYDNHIDIPERINYYIFYNDQTKHAHLIDAMYMSYFDNQYLSEFKMVAPVFIDMDTQLMINSQFSSKIDSLMNLKEYINNLSITRMPTAHNLEAYITRTYSTTSYDSCIKYSKIYNRIIDEMYFNIEHSKMAWRMLPDILLSMGLRKIRKSNGIYWLGIKLL